MTLTLFLMALDCQYFSRPADELFYNQEFPDVCELRIYAGLVALGSTCLSPSRPLMCWVCFVFPCADCWTMPHIVHAFVAVIAIVVFALLAGAFSMGEMEVRKLPGHFGTRLKGMPIQCSDVSAELESATFFYSFAFNTHFHAWSTLQQLSGLLFLHC
jgi:hypothetical protein